MKTTFFSLSGCLLIFLSAAQFSFAQRRDAPAIDTRQLTHRIQKQMKAHVKNHGISGAVTLVFWRGKMIHHAAVGLANVKNQTEMRTDHLFAIASMTKPVTATGILILEDEGKLSIDDPVSKYLPEFRSLQVKGTPIKREITIKDCLTHTAGLAGSQQTAKSLQKTTEELAKRPLAFHPGEKWQYSPGLNVCGRIIEVVSGKSYTEFLQERIFDPLKMTETTFAPSKEQQKRIVTLYQPDKQNNSIKPATHWLTDFSLNLAPNPSGGLFSTAEDMAKFYQMVLDGGKANGKQIVAEKSVRKMTSIQTGQLKTGFTPGNGWGLGWCVVREPQGVTKSLSKGSFGHGGAFGTQGWVDPTRKMIFVLMIQRTNFGNSDGSSIRGDFHQAATEGLK